MAPDCEDYPYGRLMLGVETNETNSVFALLHSWFLPATPANSRVAHLSRNKRSDLSNLGEEAVHSKLYGSSFQILQGGDCQLFHDSSPYPKHNPSYSPPHAKICSSWKVVNESHQVPSDVKMVIAAQSSSAGMTVGIGTVQRYTKAGRDLVTQPSEDVPAEPEATQSGSPKAANSSLQPNRLPLAVEPATPDIVRPPGIGLTLNGERTVKHLITKQLATCLADLEIQPSDLCSGSNGSGTSANGVTAANCRAPLRDVGLPQEVPSSSDPKSIASSLQSSVSSSKELSACGSAVGTKSDGQHQLLPYDNASVSCRPSSIHSPTTISRHTLPSSSLGACQEVKVQEALSCHRPASRRRVSPACDTSSDESSLPTASCDGETLRSAADRLVIAGTSDGSSGLSRPSASAGAAAAAANENFIKAAGALVSPVKPSGGRHTAVGAAALEPLFRHDSLQSFKEASDQRRGATKLWQPTSAAQLLQRAPQGLEENWPQAKRGERGILPVGDSDEEALGEAPRPPCSGLDEKASRRAPLGSNRMDLSQTPGPGSGPGSGSGSGSAWDQSVVEEKVQIQLPPPVSTVHHHPRNGDEQQEVEAHKQRLSQPQGERVQNEPPLHGRQLHPKRSSGLLRQATVSHEQRSGNLPRRSPLLSSLPPSRRSSVASAVQDAAGPNPYANLHTQEQTVLESQLERLTAQYAQLQWRHERLRGAYTAQVAAREGVIRQQEETLVALRNQCLVLQNRTRELLQNLRIRGPGPAPLSIETDAARSFRVHQQMGCSGPGGKCRACAAWQAAVGSVVGQAWEENQDGAQQQQGSSSWI